MQVTYPFFSIVIPVYKTEKYVTACLDSICNQTFTSFEVIAVNDGSPDQAGVICDCYSRRDKRVRVIHQTNAGVSAARERGVKEALGEYIIFMDSDDTLPENALEIFCQYLPGYDLVASANYPETELSGTEFANLLLQAKLPTALWGKAFRKTLFVPDTFPSREIKVGEDYLTNLRLARQTDKIQVIPRKVYHYRLHTASTISHNKPTLAYAKQFDQELTRLLAGAGWLEKLRVPLLHHRFNELKMIVLKKGKIDCQDPYVRSLFRECHSVPLNPEEKIILYLKDSFFSRYALKIYGKWRKIKYKNTSTYL